MYIIKIIIYIILFFLFTTAMWAKTTSGSDHYFNGEFKLKSPENSDLLKPTPDYTVLDTAQYQTIFNDSRAKIKSLINILKNYPHDSQLRVAFIVQQLLDIPYIYVGSTGEGDWQSTSSTYQSGGIHVKQDPLYRLDALDCQTFVQDTLALLYSNNIDEFDQNILKISYGASGNPSGEIVHFYNRNNFIDGDWNPINQRNGWLTDVTTYGPLSLYAKTIQATITRQNWFLMKVNTSQARVLNKINGPSMANRFKKLYSMLNYQNFDKQIVSLAYLPKEKIAMPIKDGNYLPNQALLDLIPTPSVIEIVRDPKKWMIGEKNIKDVIGSELSISHMGLLYRQTFQYGDLIYRKITCSYDDKHQKVCAVTPVICKEKQCKKLMLAHSTAGHPDNYYWYQKSDGNYICSAKPPTDTRKKFTLCNRVEQLPLFDYLTDYQYGTYRYMNNSSLLGIHIEQLS